MPAIIILFPLINPWESHSFPHPCTKHPQLSQNKSELFSGFPTNYCYLYCDMSLNLIILSGMMNINYNHTFCSEIITIVIKNNYISIAISKIYYVMYGYNKILITKMFLAYVISKNGNIM